MARKSYRRQGNTRTLYVGDSLGVGTAPGVKAKADVRSGRPSAEGLDVVRRKGGKYDRIVFDLGTNDASVKNLKQSVRGLRQVAGGKEITMATINGPDADRKNTYLKKLARQGKINLVNTKGVQLSGDGIHATGKGYKRRAKLISRALGGSSPKTTKKPVPNQELLRQYVANRETSTKVSGPKRDYAREARDL